MFHRIKKVTLFVVVCLSTHTSIGQKLNKSEHENNYRTVHWGIDEGLAKERWHNAILKDVNGFVWFGSSYGELSRFDGNSFKQYDPDRNKPGAIATNNCLGFVEDSLHNIWVGRFQGLSRYDIKADTFTNFNPHINSGSSEEMAIPFWATSNEIFCIEGDSWITTYNINSFARKKLVKIAEGDNVIAGFMAQYAIFDSASNSVWMLKRNEEGLVQFSLANGKVIHHTRVVEAKTFHSYVHKDAEAMSYDGKRNCIWINSHDGLIQFTLNDQQFHRVDAMNPFENLQNYERFVGIDIDPQGRIWFATIPKGILIYDPSSQSVTQPFSDSNLQKEVTDGNLKIYCDRDGIVWTSFWSVNGIYQLIPFSPAVHRYTANPLNPDSLSSLVIYTMLAGDHGSLWIGTPNEGLNIFNPETGMFKVLREKDLPGIIGKGIVPMIIDTLRNKAWLNAGPPDRLYEMDMQTRECKTIVFKDTANRVIPPVNIINNMARPFENGFVFLDERYGIFEVNHDSAVANLVITQYHSIHRMLVGENRKLFLRTDKPHGATYYYTNGKWIKTPHLLDSLNWSDIFYDNTDKTYWVGVNKEVIHYDKDFHKIRSYTDEGGLINEPLTVIPDGRGNIWFNNDRKIIAILNIKTGVISTLSEHDGYQRQSFDWTSPQAKAAGGSLYFAGNFLDGQKIGLDRISPDRFVQSPPSLVYLNSLKINQHDFPLSTGVNNLQELGLRYFENKISFETGIINYYSKGKSHIRYKLETKGKKVEWEYAPAYYTIRYEDLPPGQYNLVMQASNAANEFNGPEKILVINISPPFWQTWWFRILAAVSLLILLYGIYRWRTAALRKQKRILEQTVKERTAEVVEEKAEVEKQKAKSDELLLNILPFEVAEELKEKGYTTAKSFDEVTILFSDIKGFTHVAEKLTAQELVKEIDTYFSAFDNIMQHYGLEKIKTIGDAYIAAGGLPEDNTATVQNVVEAAIAMQRTVEDFKRKRVENNLPYFELRIGIHTGPVVAGVVGIKKFQYDIWGDTVNLAARMEQSGVPGKINISQYTYEKVKDQFHCEHRGKIDAKNKGEIDMYFIIS